VPRLFEVSVERVSVEHLGGLPLLEMRPIDPKGWQFLVKYAIDRVVAGIAIVLISPILITPTLAVLIIRPPDLPPARRPERRGVRHAQVPGR
jgi:lipopolysaccharide/colanic/teichoic acid biosynthesis glycosyltransferase